MNRLWVPEAALHAGGRPARHNVHPRLHRGAISKKRRTGRTLKRPSSLRQILLTGIPATGKTEVGEHPRTEHGFRHLDFEHLPTLQHYLSHGEDTFRSRANQLTREVRDTVISWGFVPNVQLPAVLVLRTLGFRWIWFDGDRSTAQREYLSLGRSPQAWERQLDLIERHIDPARETLAPVVIDTFDSEGQRRPLHEVARDVLG